MKVGDLVKYYVEGRIQRVVYKNLRLLNESR